MAITYSEISSSGISSGDFSDLSASLINYEKEIKLYRTYPAFDTDVSDLTGSRAIDLKFTACADDTRIVRAYFSAGTVYTDTYVEGSGITHSATSVHVALDITPKLFVNPGGGYDLWFVWTNGHIYMHHSSDGNTWDAGTDFSSVILPTDGTVEWISVGRGGITMVYVVIANNNNRHIVAIDASAQYEAGLYWPDTITGFDCEYLTLPADDSQGDYANSGLRHILTFASNTPYDFVTRTEGGYPVKRPQSTGGLQSFVVRPPSNGRSLQVGAYYPVDHSDEFDIQFRKGCYLTPMNSSYGSDGHDTLWLMSFASNGNVNTNDTSYTDIMLAYYSTRDGKNWTQEQDVVYYHISGTGTSNFQNRGGQLIRCGQYLYILNGDTIIRSPGCYLTNNPLTSESLDVTSRVIEYHSSVSDVRQTTVTLDNRDNVLGKSTTMIGKNISLTMITKFGAKKSGVLYKFTVATEEVDQIEPDRERPREYINITARDRMSWLTDRSQSADAIQWDNQLTGLDTFTDIGGVANSGLSHSDVVSGAFGTEFNTLILKSKYKEGIDLSTYKALLADGHAAALFSLPNPTGYGGTSSADSPTYGGVVFRVVDKDNLWMCRYNYWTDLVELIERRSGVDAIMSTYNPSSGFKTRARSYQTVGLRVEFKHSRIRVWESSTIYTIGGKYDYGFEFIAQGETLTRVGWLSGSVGTVLCAYSDQDQGDDSTPLPSTITSLPISGYGPEDAFVPSRFITVTEDGHVYYGSGPIGNPVFVAKGQGGDGVPVGSGGVDAGCTSFMMNPFNYNEIIIQGRTIITRGDISVGSPTHATVFTCPAGWVMNENGTHRGTTAFNINVTGCFFWTISNTTTHALRLYRTTDNFSSVSFIALPGNHLSRSISVGQYATAANNIELFICMSYNPGTTNNRIYRSADGGQTVSLWNTMGSFQSYMGVNVPYKLPGGASNPSPASHIYWIHDSNNMSYDSAVQFLGSGVLTTGADQSPIHTFTLDGSVALVVGSSYVWRTIDGGLTWNSVSAVPNAQSNIHGSPTNRNFYVAGGYDLSYSVDGAASWNYLTSALVAAGFNSTTMGRLVDAQIDLRERYDVGGIHP